jgi:hypothetical protein
MRALLPFLAWTITMAPVSALAVQRGSSLSLGSEAGPAGYLGALFDARWGLTEKGQLRGGASLAGDNATSTRSLYLGWNQWWQGMAGTGKARYSVKDEGVSSWAFPLHLDMDLSRNTVVKFGAEPEFFQDTFTGESGGSQLFGAGLELDLPGDLLPFLRAEWGFLHGDEALPADFWAISNRQSAGIDFLGVPQWAFGAALSRVTYFREVSASWILDGSVGFEARGGWSYDLTGDSNGLIQIRISKEI